MYKILFRGKDKATGEWICGDLVQNKEAAIIGKLSKDGVGGVDIKTHVDPNTLGQYSCLKDKNGNRIFEGDIVECYDDCQDILYIYVVKYGVYEQDGSGGEYAGADVLGWYAKVVLASYPSWMDEDDRWYYPHEYEIERSLLEINKRCGVIGNIYDNAKMLKPAGEYCAVKRKEN